MEGGARSQKRGRPKVMPDSERRRTIIDIAEKSFIQEGYAGTSIDMIAARCRISKQTFYRLFSNKLGLFTAVVESHRLQMINFREDYDDQPLEEALARIFMIDLDQESYKIRAAFLRASHLESIQYPELREVLKSHGGSKNRSELKDWLDRQCRKRGLVIADTNSAAHMLMDVFTGSVIFDAIGGFGWTDLEARLAHFRQCIAILLYGILPGNMPEASIL